MSEPARETTAPARGLGTFLAVWLSQSISMFGSQLTFFSLTDRKSVV